MIFGSNKVVRKIRLGNEELHDLYSSPNIIRVIKYWWVKLANHVAQVDGKKNS